MSCLEDLITSENPVRAIDAFAEAMDLEKLGFVFVVPEFIADETPNPTASFLIKADGYLTPHAIFSGCITMGITTAFVPPACSSTSACATWSCTRNHPQLFKQIEQRKKDDPDLVKPLEPVIFR